MLQFENVTVVCKANIYFDGKVVSHTVLDKNQKRTIGLIYPGTFTFNTDAAERMDIVAGSCRVRIGGDSDWKSFAAGTYFRVPAKSAFEIAVESAITEYVCTFE